MITYKYMLTDVAAQLDLPLSEANRICAVNKITVRGAGADAWITYAGLKSVARSLWPGADEGAPRNTFLDSMWLHVVREVSE